MEKQLSQILAGTVALLAAAGYALPKNKKHFLNVINVDTTHSMLRVPLTLALLYAASNKSNLKTTRAILLGVGIFYVAVATAGAKDRKLGRALPSGLTAFDIFYHLAVGAGAVWMGSRGGRMLKP